MPPKTKARVEDIADPLAQAAPPAAANTNVTAAEALRQRLEASRAQKSAKVVTRAEHFGAANDRSMKAVVTAHIGATRAGLGKGLFGTAMAAPSSALESVATFDMAFLAPAAGPSTAAGADSGDEVLDAAPNAAWLAAASVRHGAVLNPLSAVPDYEPWDDAILAAPSYAGGVDDAKIDNYEHHVPWIHGHNDAPPSDVVVPMVHTKEDLRRMRHERRVQAAKETQENRRNGILPKEEQRLTLKHLGTAAVLQSSVASPTELEYMIRQQMEKRMLAHYEQNEMRHRAAADQQKKHHYEVLERKAAERPVIAVYRVLGITDEYLLTNAKINAKDRLLRGMVLWIQQQWAVMVFVGGTRPLRHVDGILRRNSWPAGSTVDLIWSSPITSSVYDSRYFLPKRLTDVKPGGPEFTELVRLVKFKSAPAALDALESEGLGFVWNAIISAAPDGNVSRN